MLPESDDRRAQIRTYFDTFGEGEWARLESSAPARVSLELHARMLRRFVPNGARVLEIGAGAGRFTTALAELGARVVVSDVSSVQLELNERKVAEAGHAAAVERRMLLDIRDLSPLPDASFDVTLAYGGPLSYAFEAAPEAFAECLRVTRPGGVVLASVMTLTGTMRYLLPRLVDKLEAYGVEAMRRIVDTGDLRPTETQGHVCRMFRWAEIERMIADAPCRLLRASASNATSLGHDAALEALEANPEWWAAFLDWEEDLASEPGALEGGTHILFAVEKR